MLYQLLDEEYENAGLIETDAPVETIQELYKKAMEDCNPEEAEEEGYQPPVEILVNLLYEKYPVTKRVYVEAEINP